jgi:hypothetical protein
LLKRALDGLRYERLTGQSSFPTGAFPGFETRNPRAQMASVGRQTSYSASNRKKALPAVASRLSVLRVPTTSTVLVSATHLVGGVLRSVAWTLKPGMEAGHESATRPCGSWSIAKVGTGAGRFDPRRSGQSRPVRTSQSTSGTGEQAQGGRFDDLAGDTDDGQALLQVLRDLGRADERIALATAVRRVRLAA